MSVPEQFFLLLMFIGIFGGIIAGIPVMMVLLGAPLLTAVLGILLGAFDPALLGAFPNRIYGIMGNSLLYSVPLFILMGKLLEHSGLAERMLVAVSTNAKNQKRSLALSVLALSVLIAASTGIIGATITMLAAIALPVMLRADIPERLSAGLIVAAGSLGQILPPSILLILLTDQISNAWIVSQREIGNFAPDPISINHLFAGAILPGLMLAALYAIFLTIRLKKQSIIPSIPVIPGDDNSTSGLFSVLPLVLLIALVPGSILTGIATVTEAACLGVIGTLMLWYMSDLKGSLRSALFESVEITGVIFGIIIAASFLSLVFRGFEGDQIVSELVLSMPGEKFGALAIVMVAIFLLGFLIEFVEITYIVIPVTAPVLFSIGIDPIWFAILVAVNLQMSFLTPPLGIALFYFKSVASTQSLVLYRAIIPFILLQALILLAVLVFPPFATFLPSFLV